MELTREAHDIDLITNLTSTIHWKLEIKVGIEEGASIWNLLARTVLLTKLTTTSSFRITINL